MKKIIGKKVWIGINGYEHSLDTLYKNCRYMNKPKEDKMYNLLINTNNFDEAFNFIKSNNFNSLSATKIGKIKVIHYSNFNTFTTHHYFKFNFKSLAIAEEFIDCSNDFSIVDLSEILFADEFLEYCKDYGIK